MKNNPATPKPNAEQRIKDSARQIFLSKGYGSSRTREIAEKANANPALVNYYFRSKERLFEVVMIEMMSEFMQHVALIVNSNRTSFEDKITLLVEAYTELGVRNPSLPMFVLNEMRKGHAGVAKQVKTMRKILRDSIMAQQLEALISKKKIKKTNMIYVMTNLLGLTIFPFIAAPLIQTMGGIKDHEFYSEVRLRKNSIPLWIMQTLKT